MKTSIRRPLSFLVVVGAALATAKILTLMNLKDLPSQMGISWLVAVKPVDNYLAKSFPPSGSGAVRTDIVPPSSFMRPWYELLAYGSMILAGGLQLGGLLSGLLGAAVAPQDETPISLLAVAVAYSFSIIIFFLGVWIGARCDRFAIPTLFAVAIIGRSIGAAADFLFLSEAQFQQVTGLPKTAGWLIAVFIGANIQSILLTVIFGLLGFWVGRRRRYGRYVDFVLLKLPKEDRVKVADSVYQSASELMEESQRSSVQANTNTPQGAEAGT